MDVECDFCGRTFNKRPSHLTEHNFCSKECYSKWQSQSEEWKEIVKENGKQLENPEQNFGKKLKGEGEDNPRWNGGTSAGYIKKLSQKYLGERCELCGSKNNLVPHHRNHNRQDNREDNIATLCHSCHCRLHHYALHFNGKSLRKKRGGDIKSSLWR